MAQVGFTPILIYSSTTASQAPAAGSLTNSTLGSELAINITDGKLFYKDNANAIQVIAWKVTPTTAGGTGLTSYTAGDMVYWASGTTFTKLAIGAAGYWMSSSGTAPQWNAPAALTKTDDTNVTLTLGGSASTALLNAASLTLGWTGQLATGRGGTGLSAYTAGDLLYYSAGTALSKLGIGASTTILTSTGSAPQWSAASGVSVGTATNLAGGVAGSVPYQTGAGATTFLGIGAANTVITSTGSAPQWSTSISLASTATATAFIPSSSTVPTNGLYLSSANTLAWATNSTFRMLLNSGGLAVNTTTQNALLTVASSYTSTGVPNAGNSTAWLINDAGSVTADNGPGITFNARTRTGPTEIQPMAGLKGAKLNANNDEIAGYLAFYTSDNTNRVLVERARIDNLGNYIPKAASKGINFTANTAAAGMTSQLLNWYEEGTWTPTQGAGLTVVGAFTSSGTYTRVGRLVTIFGKLSGATSIAAAAGAVITSGYPFTPAMVAAGTATNSNTIGCVTYLSDGAGSVIYAGAALGAASIIYVTASYYV